MELSKQSRSSLALSLLKSFLLMTTGGIALMTLIILVGIWRTGSRFFAGIEELFNAPPSIPQVDVPTLIVQQVSGVSELTTAAFVMETVVPTSQDSKLGSVVVATTKLLYIAHGEVRAGIDLNNLTADDVKVQNNNVQIHLPPPQILDSKIDVNRSRVYDYDRGFLSLGPDVAPQLQTLAQRQTLQKIVATACTEGLLEQANHRAKLAITQLLTTAGYERVEVTTTLPSPQACKPLPPTP
ncbi:MAG: DUF4230 domain-containing protein [Xenococcaceae cyanobacterium]